MSKILTKDEKTGIQTFLTVDEAARFLRVSRSAVYQAAKNKQIPAVRVGRQYRIPKEGLEEWISKQTEVSG